MARYVSPEEALCRLRALKPYGVKLSDLAARFEVSPAYVSAVLKGKKKPNEAMARAVGLRRTEAYEVVPDF